MSVNNFMATFLVILCAILLAYFLQLYCFPYKKQEFKLRNFGLCLQVQIQGGLFSSIFDLIG